MRRRLFTRERLSLKHDPLRVHRPEKGHQMTRLPKTLECPKRARLQYVAPTRTRKEIPGLWSLEQAVV